MSLGDDVNILVQLGGCKVFPIPPACQQVIVQARMAGFPIGNLFVLSQPLTRGVLGSYDRRSGDLWCYYDAQSDQGACDVVQTLLSIIAYVKLHFPPPATIEEDWEQFRRAHREAASLAMAWGQERFFSASDLDALLERDTSLETDHLAASELVGIRSPSLARAAYRALLEVQQRYQWGASEFTAALWGLREEDEDANAATLDFDRCRLRSRWLGNGERDQENQLDLFGAYTLTQTPSTARTLRHALVQATGKQEESSPQAASVLLHLEEPEDLPQVLAVVNTRLLLDFPLRAARVRWVLYADPPGEPSPVLVPHLYRLHIEYVSEEIDEVEPIIRRGVWVLVPVRPRSEVVEAAWQRSIRSWLACTELRVETLYEGLQGLWDDLHLKGISRQALFQEGEKLYETNPE